MFKASLKNLRRHSKGFSLVEVLVAMVIILVLVAAITPLLVFNSQTSRYNRVKAAAKNLANQRTEEVRALEFAAVGTLGGNPSGNLETSETRLVDGNTYTINTYINWEDQGGCLGGDDASWDVKLLRVEVVGESYLGSEKKEVRETIETLIARDSEQPLLMGANIRVCVFRGWDYEVSLKDEQGNAVAEEARTLRPAEGVEVKIVGPQSSTVFSTAEASALFINIEEGDYNITVSKPGLIVMPGTDLANISALENSTIRERVFVEEPASLSFQLLDAEGSPLYVGSGGMLTLTLPAPLGVDLTKNFSATGASGYILPGPLFNDLWPHPEESGSYYVLSAVDIPGYFVKLDGINDTATGKPWSGFFDAPGQTKTLTIALRATPSIESGSANAAQWVQSSEPNRGKIKTDLEYKERIAREGNILKNGIFERSGNGDISLDAGKHIDFTGVGLAFKGSPLDLGSGAELVLNANYVYFTHEIALGGAATIILDTLNTTVPDNDGYLALLDLAGEVVEIEGESLLVEAENLSPLLKGHEIAPVGSFEGFGAGSNYRDQDYGQIVFEKDVEIGAETINRGVYYFPHGFNFAADAGKVPEEGGLILLAD